MTGKKIRFYFFLNVSILFFSALFFPQGSFGKPFQDSSETDTLSALAKLMQRGKNDSVRWEANSIFNKKIHEILLRSETFNFDSVKNISVISAADNSFRILTWTLPSYDGFYSYYGMIHVINKKTHESKIIDLVDSTASIGKPESAKLRASNWYGAVYYKMITNKSNDKTYYTLLGWKGKNNVSTEKVIDVLYFSGDQPLFGFPLFKTESVYRNRLTFLYPSQVVMSLRYVEGKKMIVFDHISKKAGDTNMHGPEGSYDALKFKGGKWVLMKDIDMRTNWESKEQPKEPQMHEAPVEMIK